MSEIQYQSAKTVKEAVKMMQAAKGKGYILAGGTDLLVQMKSGARTPGVIAPVKKIPEMVSGSEKNGAFTIGAATPAAVLGENKKLRKAWPGVIEACNLIGSHPVQGPAPPRPRPPPPPAAICATPRRPPTACPPWSPQAASSTWQAPTASAPCRS